MTAQPTLPAIRSGEFETPAGPVTYVQQGAVLVAVWVARIDNTAAYSGALAVQGFVQRQMAWQGDAVLRDVHLGAVQADEAAVRAAHAAGRAKIPAAAIVATVEG